MLRGCEAFTQSKDLLFLSGSSAVSNFLMAFPAKKLDATPMRADGRELATPSVFSRHVPNHQVPYRYRRGRPGNSLIIRMPATNPPTCAQNAIPPLLWPVSAMAVAVPLKNWMRNQ